jgi:hypothetical protein
MWSPCLEGPGTHGYTMDSAGPLGPAWMRLVRFPLSIRPSERVRGGSAGWPRTASASVCLQLSTLAERSWACPTGSQSSGEGRII